MIIGLVGKPSSGKSTFFSAATLVDVARAAYPFTTIEPNKGIGFARIDCIDSEFNTQCNPRTGFCEKHQRFVPVEIIDVAGLVPGAHEGLGRGNQFLTDLSKADALIHVIDASGSINEKGEAVGQGNYDPLNDVRFLEEEIGFWFLGVIKKNWQKFSRTPFDSKAKMLEVFSQNLSGIGANTTSIEQALLKTNLIEKKLNAWSEEEQKAFAFKLRELSKPVVIAANKADISNSAENIERMSKEFPELLIIACSAESELALKKAVKAKAIHYLPGDNEFELINVNEGQKKALEIIKEKVLKKFNSTGVQELLNKTVFDVLKYVAVFPGGVGKLEDSEGRRLPDCFLMPPKSTALDFAFKLHTDFGKNFIRAVDVKTKKMIGKDYELKHRDVIEIISAK